MHYQALFLPIGYLDDLEQRHQYRERPAATLKMGPVARPAQCTLPLSSRKDGSTAMAKGEQGGGFVITVSRSPP